MIWSQAGGGKSIAFISPNGHVIKLSPNYACVQPYVSLTKGFFFFFFSEMDAEVHGCLQC